jgi:hypothetical protein
MRRCEPAGETFNRKIHLPRVGYCDSGYCDSTRSYRHVACSVGLGGPPWPSHGPISSEIGAPVDLLGFYVSTGPCTRLPNASSNELRAPILLCKCLLTRKLVFPQLQALDFAILLEYVCQSKLFASPRDGALDFLLRYAIFLMA